MRATCVRVIAVQMPTTPSNPKPHHTTVLEVTTIPHHELMTINLSSGFRRHFAMINPHRRGLIQQTMPIEVELESSIRRGQAVHRIARHDLDHWADQIRIAAEAPRSFSPCMKSDVMQEEVR